MWRQKPRKSFLNGKEVDMNKSTAQNKAPPKFNENIAVKKIIKNVKK